MSVSNKRLEINNTETGQKNYLAFSDCASVILNHRAIWVTQAALASCAEAGVVLITTDAKHFPIALTLPVSGNRQGGSRPLMQAEVRQTHLPSVWWQEIIQAKIQGQKHNLERLHSAYKTRLDYLMRYTMPGDSKNHEALAAQIYWKEYFKLLRGSGKRIKKNARDTVNQHLNYGYAIIRSLVARSLVAGGFCMNFGVGHRRRDNPFNLVEDFMEPFRPLVDWTVFGLYTKNPDLVFESSSKVDLVRLVLQEPVQLGGRSYRFIPSCDAMITRFGFCLQYKKRGLHLPYDNVPLQEQAPEAPEDPEEEAENEAENDHETG